jgi:hypothetical protein
MKQQSAQRVQPALSMNPISNQQRGAQMGDNGVKMQQQSAQRILPAPLMNPIIAHQRGVPMGDNGVKIMD